MKKPGQKQGSRRSRGKSRPEPGHGGFRSPAAAYVAEDVPVLPTIPARLAPPAAATRATPDALRSLEERGYSRDEIFALVVPKRTFARRQRRHESLTVEETDKALRLARVAELAEQVFADKTKAHRWLRKPKRSLRGETPLAYLASEGGARLVEDMLYRIDDGVFA
jgi:putative toxin-antitoxin system antitoxin component (TIGR02293 family)